MRLCAQWCMSFEVQSDSDPGKKHRVTFSLDRPTCTCKSFEHSTSVPKVCKHVMRVLQKACMWSDAWVGGDMTLIPIDRSWSATIVCDDKCPRCGGPTVIAKFVH